MSIHVVPDSCSYQIDDASVVTVRVTIGDAQGGGWVIAWDDKSIVAKGADPDLVTIGIGKDLRGRTLQVAATAVDIRMETNRLSSVLTLDGGIGGQQRFVGSWNGGTDGDVAVFATLVKFL